MNSAATWDLTTIAVTLAACGTPSNTVDAATIDAPAGANSISGMVNGTGFNAVGAVYWIGTPDSPGTDTSSTCSIVPSRALR